jgi:hypothetical protein
MAYSTIHGKFSKVTCNAHDIAEICSLGVKQQSITQYLNTLIVVTCTQ